LSIFAKNVRVTAVLVYQKEVDCRDPDQQHLSAKRQARPNKSHDTARLIYPTNTPLANMPGTPKNPYPDYASDYARRQRAMDNFVDFGPTGVVDFEEQVCHMLVSTSLVITMLT
jgi:hypothetical protein